MRPTNLLWLVFLFLCLEEMFLVGQETESEKKIGKLIELLQNRDPKRRVAAAEKLSYMEIKTTEKIQVLINALKDDKSKVRYFCFMTLCRNGEKIYPFLCESLKNEDTEIKCYLAGVIGQIGPKPQIKTDIQLAISRLMEIIENDEDIRAKSSAIWALGHIGPDSKKSITLLLNLLRDKKLYSHYAEPPFFHCVYSFGHNPRPPELDKYIIDALGGMDAIEVLTYLLRDSDERFVLWAIDSLVGSSKAVPLLIDLLQHTQNATVKEAVIATLGKTAEIQALPAIIEASQNENVEIRSSAVTALGSVGRKKVSKIIPYLLQALHDKDASVRIAAAREFMYMGKESIHILPELYKALEDEKSEQVQKEIHRAILSVEEK